MAAVRTRPGTFCAPRPAHGPAPRDNGPVHRVSSHADLLRLSGDDPWVRWSVPDPFTGEVWVHDDVALVERVGRRRGFWVAPLRHQHGRGQLTDRGALADEGAREQEADRVRSALTALRDGGHLTRLGSESVSVVQEHGPVAHEVLDLGPGGDWDWMWTTSDPPAHPLEEQVVVLDDSADAEELQAFSTTHNPRVWTEIGTGRVTRWVGLRDADGSLLAVGGAESEQTGVPHLAGIVSHTGRRGQGLGTAVSAELTRWAVREHRVSTLGMFSDNDVARAVYRRLGYRTARAWHSRQLLPQCPPRKPRP